jgi:hypothetical protein
MKERAVLLFCFLILTLVFCPDAYAKNLNREPFSGMNESGAEEFYIGNIRVQKTLQNGKVVWEAVSGVVKGAENHDGGINPFEYQSPPSYESGYEGSALECFRNLLEKAKDSGNHSDHRDALEYAKNPELWRTGEWSSFSEGEIGGGSVLNSLYYNNVPYACDIFFDWIDFASKQEGVVNLNVEMDIFYNYLDKFTENKSIAIAFFEKLIENEDNIKCINFDTVRNHLRKLKKDN